MDDPAGARRKTFEDKTVIKKTRSKGLWMAVLALGGLVAITSYPPAEASPPIAKTDVPRPAVRMMTSELVQTTEPETRVSAEDDAACTKVRKRLWVDGEGWIVRRVSICR
jgi:hypothetical protein